MTAILDEYDDANAFGNVLASIQILPALVGKSLVDLKMSCPSETQRKFNLLEHIATLCSDQVNKENNIHVFFEHLEIEEVQISKVSINQTSYEYFAMVFCS